MSTFVTTTPNISRGASLQRPSIVAAWVDQGIGEVGMHKYIKERFGTLSTFITQWFFFDSSENFTFYIENNPNIKLICVMSGGMSRLLVPKHSNLGALHTVYVFCADIERARTSMADETKVKGIFNIEDALYEQMADDLSKLLVEEGIALAQLDERSLARSHYEEAKRLLSTQAKNVSSDDEKARMEEIDVRLDQLLV
ncbi:unnamed protein product [Rotaria magnacalcarata]|uniref:Uncharacterized protein n=1 Tax=Rotaria magnacalcarata TaxID=392030 RepID=A0A816PPC2_9BILA|nr:unnamed protein product [Rotaria magnacalcarata]CAF1592503.1 unnamed protein product [Rotaria magnacalcarata]CAF2051255.1 unnamed protein product [Rotaria magnacalcarata]CAF2114111.1 unnamed protein product [Rotaria magnacalcarata]CAF2240650.1 unnamed protein product [Rotaria magnacalcarata]